MLMGDLVPRTVRILEVPRTWGLMGVWVPKTDRMLGAGH